MEDVALTRKTVDEPSDRERHRAREHGNAERQSVREKHRPTMAYWSVAGRPTALVEVEKRIGSRPASVSAAVSPAREKCTRWRGRSR